MKNIFILIVMITMICSVLQSQDSKSTKSSHERLMEYVEVSKTLVESHFNYRMKTLITVTEIGEFDAATSLDGDVPIIRINIKRILDYPEHSIYILLIHEMVHAVQGEISDIKKWNNKLALHLYWEGVAVYLSSIIFPGYDEWQYVDHFQKDASNYLKYIAYKKKAIEYISNILENGSEIEIANLFKISSRMKELPSRIGYYIGKEIIKDLEINGFDLIGLKEEEYIDKVRNYLKKTL